MTLPGKAQLTAFGRSVELETGPNTFQRQDSLWRTREIYERTLGIHHLL